MKEDIRNTGRPFNSQKDIEVFAAEYIIRNSMVSGIELEDAIDENLREMHNRYESVFDADIETVCNDSIQRINKITQNLSNNGVFEEKHDIVTINVREANRLAYKRPNNLKFSGTFYATRAYADAHGYPTLKTLSWAPSKQG